MDNVALQNNKGRSVQSTARYIPRDGVRHLFARGPADDRHVMFHDMRGVAEQPTLEREGFALVQHRSAVADFTDAEQVGNLYLSELQQLVRRLIGTEHVFMQPGWVLRTDDATQASGSRESVDGKRRSTKMGTGGLLHVDYNPASAADFAKISAAAAGVSARPKGRLLGINTWRPFSPPPQDKPLALLDRRTVDAGDLIETDMGISTPSTGATPGSPWVSYQLAYNPTHRFCWWSDMTRDEVLVFIQYDEGRGPASGVAHTAFQNPSCPPGTPPRHSIEARAYVFLED